MQSTDAQMRHYRNGVGCTEGKRLNRVLVQRHCRFKQFVIVIGIIGQLKYRCASIKIKMQMQNIVIDLLQSFRSCLIRCISLDLYFVNPILVWPLNF